MYGEHGGVAIGEGMFIRGSSPGSSAYFNVRFEVAAIPSGLFGRADLAAAFACKEPRCSQTRLIGALPEGMNAALDLLNCPSAIYMRLTGWERGPLAEPVQPVGEFKPTCL